MRLKQYPLSNLVLPLLVTLTALFTNCSSISEFMIAVPLGTPARAADLSKATVVFMRPSSYGSGISADIMNDKGAFLGDIMDESRFVIQVTPGHHTFIIKSEHTDAVSADVIAGKTYFIEVGLGYGFIKPRFYFCAIKPTIRNWAKREEWIASTRLFETNFAKGQADYQTRLKDLQERIQEGHQHLREYVGEELEKHTIRPGDGI